MQASGSTVEGEEEVITKPKPFPDYEVPGVRILTLNELTQTSLGLVVGIDVTGEYPWKTVHKELIYDNIQVLGDESPFALLKKELDAYEDSELLIGYLLDETNDEDEFYVCLTPEAREHCREESEAFMEKQYAKLEESVVKESRPWPSLGSEQEVDENIPKKNRPLLKIEIKSKFPVPNQPKRFLERSTEAARDGYIELTPTRAKFYNVAKKRVDASIQANPENRTSFAQTVPRFPQNVWTQCELEGESGVTGSTGDAGSGGAGGASAPAGEADEDADKPKVVVEPLSRRAEKEKEMAIAKLNSFLTEKTKIVERILQFNGKVDIYNLDYPSLVKDEELSKVTNMEFQEYKVLTDFKAKGKFISAAAWHQLYGKLVAVTYADSVPSIIKYPDESTDEIIRAVYGENPVFVWSLSDALKPKLYLESNREVVSLSFCPYHENILIGGCVNGQIVVWDLDGRLEETEDFELLSEYQENNRIAMNSKMKWMKIIHDKSVVRTTAASNLMFNHHASVSDISWISSHFEISNKGKLKLLPEKEKSMQFVSISIDGTILIWNIKSTSSDNIPEKLKDSKRITSRPTNLILETSPLRVFDGILKPIYKIIAQHPGSSKLDSLLCLNFEYPSVNTIKIRADTRVPRLYEADINRNEIDEKKLPIICTTSMYGDYLKISWGGGEASAGVGVTSENAKYLCRARIHGGPITCCIRNPYYKDIVATVGGKTIAIWSSKSLEKPFIWKKMNYYLTGAAWSNHIPSQIYTISFEGTIDIWDFLDRSEQPVRTQVISGSFMTGIYCHKLIQDQFYFVGLANSFGFFRLFYLPRSLVKAGPNDVHLTDKFFEREYEVNTIYQDWTAVWVKNNQDYLIQKQKETEEIFLQRDANAKMAAKKEEDRKKHESEAAAKLKAQVISGEMMWKRLQWEGVEISIQIRKALNTAELLFQQKPLRDIAQQKFAKLKMMMEGLKGRQKVFDEAVAILFPEVIPKPAEAVTIKTVEEVNEIREKYMSEFYDVSIDAEKFMKTHSYDYKFVWTNVAQEGKQHRRHLDTCANIFTKRTAKITRRIKESMA